MECRQVSERLEELTLNALPKHETESLQAHVKECSVCTGEMKRLQTLQATLGEIHRLYETAPPARRPESIPPLHTVETGRVLRWRSLAIAAAVLFVAAPGLWFALRSEPRTPTPATPTAKSPSPEPAPKPAADSIVVTVDEKTQLKMTAKTVYEFKGERSVQLEEGALECSVDSTVYTLELPNGKVLCKAAQVKVTVEKQTRADGTQDTVTIVRVLDGSAFFVGKDGTSGLVRGSRGVIITSNGRTRIMSASVNFDSSK